MPGPLRGEMSHFTGVDDPDEPPLSPDLHLRTDQESVGESASDSSIFSAGVGACVDNEYESRT